MSYFGPAVIICLGYFAPVPATSFSVGFTSSAKNALYHRCIAFLCFFSDMCTAKSTVVLYELLDPETQVFHPTAFIYDTTGRCLGSAVVKNEGVVPNQPQPNRLTTDAIRNPNVNTKSKQPAAC